ncbi:serine hydrolase domain-containing protein [Paenibacillus harenae]|uniref:CubicO group peptidase (Beta-lactamase class C family) n=1 Tax=Paenibacillus harenae TaxID=306543 RepID=A0ABT9U2Q3_PAEHA|nr:serine hydrolase domain-containing protein [Paenibacillus harenae]MDQ0113914.1 CubicO group peptidase (beta-lactamase class C family) [Paenibacillus harenae]
MTITGHIDQLHILDSGFDPAVKERLDRHFEQLVREGKVHCASYLLSRDGTVFAEEAFGKLKHDQTDALLRNDSIRRVASVTKLFTAAAIFQLVEQGKLFLRQSVSEWIEEFKHPMYEKIQIWHLLTHTSGIQADPGYYMEPYPMGYWDVMFAFQPETEGPFAVTDPEELEKQRCSAWLRAVLSGKPLAAPGEQWTYSSAAYAILGEVIARASATSYDEYVMERIVKPLGMNRTFFEVPEELHAEVCIINDFEVSRLRKDDRKYGPPRAGGGLHSTLGDLFRFGQMLLNGGTLDGVRILSRKSVEKLTDNALDSGIKAFCWGGNIQSMTYGIGASLTGPGEWIPEGSFGHEGAGRCKLLIDAKNKAVIVFFVPSNMDWCPESMIGTQNLIGSGWL